MIPLILLLALLLGTTPSGAGQLRLTWTDNADNENEFRVERCRVTATSGNPCHHFRPIATLEAAESSGDQATWVNNRINVGRTFCYRVRAFNSSGASAYSNIACARVPALPLPLDTTESEVQ